MSSGRFWAWSAHRKLAPFRRLHVLALAGLLASLSGTPAPAADSTAPQHDAAMTRRVDELLAAAGQSGGSTPGPPAADADFVRGVDVDLTAVVPPVAVTEEFLRSEQPDKRTALVDRLLESPAHATHLADVWRDLMLPRMVDPQQTAGIVGVQNWLRRQFVDNRRYDRIVADLLVATGGDESGPALFYTTVGVKPEELGTRTARIFLGIRLDCAQCHDHPFDRWTQEDFWGYAAFFARLQQRNDNAATMRLVDVSSGEVYLPETTTVVAMRYPGGETLDGPVRGTRRQQLAIWMVSRGNPYLGPAAVNLVWSQLFGRGLVEPIDDFGGHNTPSHPEVLDELSRWFVDAGYDLRRLHRVLANTRAYQLSSRHTGDDDPPPELFARMAIKTMTAEQLYDSLSTVGLRPAGEIDNRLADPQRQAFLIKMLTQTRTVTDFELGVPQALTLLNGTDLNALADAAQSKLLAALDAPFLDESQRVRTAFLATLTRPPNDHERSEFVEYLRAQPPAARQAALGDVVWALVNSAEFMLNH